MALEHGQKLQLAVDGHIDNRKKMTEEGVEQCEQQ